jgi:hypothetical protein
MSMSTALINTAPQAPQLPMVPWRDPQSVSPGVLKDYIQRLEAACLEDPRSADLRTCLALAYAVNFEVYKSMDALEAATVLDPTHFWAQLKYGELHYRLRALRRAEEETVKAVELAGNPVQLSLARKQLQEIRELTRSSIRNVTWDKPLTKPALVFVGMMLLVVLVMVWK